MENRSRMLLYNVRLMVTVWRLRGNVIRTALCWIVWHNVHSPQHKNRPRNDLLCVEWDVEPYTLTLWLMFCIVILCLLVTELVMWNWLRHDLIFLDRHISTAVEQRPVSSLPVLIAVVHSQPISTQLVLCLAVAVDHRLLVCLQPTLRLAAAHCSVSLLQRLRHHSETYSQLKTSYHREALCHTIPHRLVWAAGLRGHRTPPTVIQMIGLDHLRVFHHTTTQQGHRQMCLMVQALVISVHKFMMVRVVD